MNLQDRERVQLKFNPEPQFMDALSHILAKVLMMRLEQDTEFMLEETETTRPLQSGDIHMRLAL